MPNFLLSWSQIFCMLFNAKSILYKETILFQTIQFSINTQYNNQTHFISRYSVCQIVLIQTIQLSIIGKSI